MRSPASHRRDADKSLKRPAREARNERKGTNAPGIVINVTMQTLLNVSKGLLVTPMSVPILLLRRVSPGLFSPYDLTLFEVDELNKSFIEIPAILF